MVGNSWTMDRSMNSCRLFFANILHDVNFTASRPANRGTITTKQPESRPESLTVRNFDASYEKTIGKVKVTIGTYASRSILTGTIPALKPFRSTGILRYQSPGLRLASHV